MPSYEELRKKAEKITLVGDVGNFLGWDQEVMMPEGGAEARAMQSSAVSGLHHRLLTSEELGKLINDLSDQDLESEQEAVVRELEREHRRASRVDEELVSKISSRGSKAVETWRRARENDDFESFRPELEKMVELKREYARQIDPGKEPYRVLFDDYEPYIDFERMESVLEELKQELVPLLQRIRESEDGPDQDVFEGSYPTEKQMELSRRVVEELGFDFERGRLDRSTHPFTSGNQFDTRLTTRFDEEDLKRGILPTIHECGHGMYQQGLPREKYGLPVGEARDFSVHESQSRLWENHVARSREFWEYMLPVLEEYFQVGGASAEECYETVNHVKEDNLIRVEADELTYHLHIVLRFELGRKLVNDEIEVRELPELWNQKMEEYLGVRPETNTEGVLQDIHWSWGNFGYFPTYSLGSVLAAQLYRSAEEDIDGLEEKIASGEFEPLLEWLRENIHCHGKRFETDELIRKATGGDLKAEAFLEYVERKYGEIYNL